MINIAALQSDPEFTALPFAEKVKAVASLDPEFAQLSPEEQHKGLAQLFPPDARDSIQQRQQNPPATANGDPNAGNNGINLHDVGAAIGHGLKHFLGLPSMENGIGAAALDVAGKISPVVGLGQRIYNAGHDVIAGNPSPVQGSATENVLGHVPIVGRALQAIGGPAAAYANGQAPTRDQNMGAIDAGTQVAANAALASPTVQRGVAAVAQPIGQKVGAAINGSAAGTYADALAAKGSEMRPLGESIGEQLLAKNKTMRDPRTELRTAFDPNRGPQNTETAVPKFIPKANPNRVAEQLQALKDAHPNADITDGGDHFKIQETKPAAERVSVSQQQADQLAEQAPAAQAPTGGILGRINHPVAATAGALIGGALGHPALGAEVGVGAAEGMATMKRLISSPLWKTTSAVMKKDVGQAMMNADYQTVVNVGSKVLAGQNLEDDNDYGHDAALHGLLTQITQGQNVSPQDLSQLLQGYDAVYVDPSGTAHQIPHNIQRQTYNALSVGQ